MTCPAEGKIIVTAPEIGRLVGQRVALRLAAGAPGGPTVTGRLAGVLDALDGFVVSLVLDEAADNSIGSCTSSGSERQPVQAL